MSSDAKSPDPSDVDPQTVLGPDAQPQNSSGNTASATTQPQHIHVHHYTKGAQKFFGRLLLWTGWLAVVVLVCVIVYLRKGRQEYYDTTGGVRERFHSGNETADNRVAIILVRGVILEGDRFVKRQIERVREDKSVKAAVVRIESPGGTVSGSDYIYYHLKKLRDDRKIPVVVSMGALAASGGYYVAMAAGSWDQPKNVLTQTNTIFAEETTTTGSIGVIIPHYDLSGFLAEHNIKNDSIASGEHKQMLSMTKEISSEQRELLKKHVDELFVLFKGRVKSGRPNLTEAEIDKLATGEIFTARHAKTSGLVDKIGFIDDAVQRAVDLAKLDKDNVRIVEYTQPPTLLDQFIGVAQTRRPGIDLSAVLDLSTPQAYYLFTTLPPLVSTRVHE